MPHIPVLVLSARENTERERENVSFFTGIHSTRCMTVNARGMRLDIWGKPAS